MAQSKTTPALWFHTRDGKTEQVTAYYKTVFEDNFLVENVMPLGETPSGYSEMSFIRLFGQSYLIMTTAIEHHQFNDSFAIVLYCSNQEEIDKYWNYFTKEGKESMCGWCIDRFGLRWQVIPQNMGELMSRPNAGKVMMKQTKIVIADY